MDEGRVFFVFERDFQRLLFAFSKIVDHGVVRDAVQPTRKRPPRIVFVYVAVGFDEYFLDEVFGFFVGNSRNTHHVPQKLVGKGVDDFRKRLRIAVYAFYEFTRVHIGKMGYRGMIRIIAEKIFNIVARFFQFPEILVP